jgi:hypothetical protein
MSISPTDVATQMSELAAIPLFAGCSDSELAVIAVLSLSAGVVIEGGDISVDTTLLAKEVTLQAIRDLLPSDGVFSSKQSGTWNIGSITTLPPITGSVSVGNFPTAFQVSNFPGTQAVTQSGTWTFSSTGLTDTQLRASAISVIPSDGTNLVSVSTATADGVSVTLNRLRVASASLGFNGTTWDMLRSGITGVVSSVTGFLNGLVFGQYKASPPSLTDGQYTSLQLDSSGNLKTASQGLKLNGSTATAVTINSSGGVILATNTARTGAVITNLSNSVCYLFFTGAAGAAGTGSPLTTYGSAYVIDATNLYQGAIYGITAAGTTAALSITEFN